MSRVRPPAVAGSFYPEDPRELEREVLRHLDAASADPVFPTRAKDEQPPKALIAPHAGYVYSGPVAASAYARVSSIRSRIEKVVLLGPSHRVPLEGLAAPASDVFETPLGGVPVDREAIEILSRLPQVSILDAAHDHEHSLEVQLPFLQLVLDRFTLVPLAVGDATAHEVAEVLELLWGGPETLLVVSSDLSHYYDYETARRMDVETSRAIENLRTDALGVESACGRVPTRGLLVAARRHQLRGRTIDLRSSGDTAGPRNQVVGYGAYVFA